MIRRYVFSLQVIMAILFLTGCTMQGKGGHDMLSDNSADKGITVSNDAVSRDAFFVINTGGYEKEGSKEALLISSFTEDDFKIMEGEREVYEGRVRYRKLNDSDDVGICDFSDFSEEGSYYIMTDSGIASEEFLIGSEVYSKILRERISGFLDKPAPGSDTMAGDLSGYCLGITDRLLAHEFFQDAIGESNDDPMVIPRTILSVKPEIEAMLKLSDKDGSLKGRLSDDTGGYYQYSAVLSLFSYEYEGFDKKYASECGRVAAGVFKNAEKQYEGSSDSVKKALDDKRYWAAAQLYKLTGSREYKVIAEDYAVDPPKGFREDKNGYLGTVAYLTCYKGIDLDTGEILITALMDDINDAVRISFKGDYLVSVKGEMDKDKIGILYENARLMVLGNYISKNIRYVEAGENQVAYLYGRNELGKDYAYGPDSDYYNEPLEFVLGGLIDSYIYNDKEPEAMKK